MPRLFSLPRTVFQERFSPEAPLDRPGVVTFKRDWRLFFQERQGILPPKTQAVFGVWRRRFKEALSSFPPG